MNFILLTTLIGIFSHQITTVCITKTTVDANNVKNDQTATVALTSVPVISTDEPVPFLIASKKSKKTRIFLNS